MRKRDIFIILFAIIAALSIAYIIRLLLLPVDNKPAVIDTISNVETTEVLVAGVPLKMGAKLSTEAAVWRKWPLEAVNPSYITKGSALSQKIKGSFVRRPLVKDEPIMEGDLVVDGQKGFLASLVGPGMRAITLAVDAAAVGSGLIGPGDYVDVIKAGEQKADDGGKAIISEGEVVAENVKVLALDHFLDTESLSKQDNFVPHTVTLEVSTDQAAELTNTIKTGVFSLVLRGLNENAKKAPKSELLKETFRVIKVIRGKEETSVTVGMEEQKK